KQFCITAERRKSFGAHVRQQMQAQERVQLCSAANGVTDMLLTLSQIPSLGNIKQDDRNCRDLPCLLQLKKEYNSVIRERRALLGDLDNQILELEKKAVKQNQRAVKAKQASSSKDLQKQIETLETCLRNVTVHFHTNMTRNKKLQEEIEDLQMQKEIFGNLYFKLHKELDQLGCQMNTVMEQAMQAYEERMEDLARISDMKERNSKDIVKYNIELQERQCVLDQEARLKSLMCTKFTNRSELEEEAVKKRALKAAQKAKRSQVESFESHQVAYERLLEMAEDRHIDRLLNDLMKMKKKNFACFRYVTELNSELGKIDQRVKDLQSEIMALMMDREHAESSSLHVLKELEEKLNKTTEEANWYEEQYKVGREVLDLQISGMEALCKEINCDTMKIVKQLAENEQNMDLNLKQLFGLIEKKINELLLMESVLRYTAADESDPAQTFVSPLLGGIEVLQEMDLAQLYLLAPTLASTIDIINTVDVPLDRSQLHELVLQSQEESWGNTTDMNKTGRNSVK
ncbi:CCD63 protein, partial [Eurystomus gularis]|nr:CCD63 protein [Eurystomus gularis]